ncbi:hypothetical protein, partial [Paenibacillus macerans]|uniref:hypothetical protein n=1 Tax=Paenibacillus macerans TaxID=44252 RepID=UPI00203D9F57
IAFKGFIKMLTLFSHDTPRPLYVVFYCTRWLLQRVYFLVYIQYPAFFEQIAAPQSVRNENGVFSGK